MASSTKKSKQDSSTVTLEPVQLPFWPTSVRALPNAFVRSALFGVENLRAGARAHHRRKTIVALKGIRITYTGEALRQDDSDLYQQVLHLARMEDLGAPVKFTAYAMLTELGWSKNVASYKRLSDGLDRLSATNLVVSVDLPDGGVKHYGGSLIRTFKSRETANGEQLRHWEITLEREIITLFSADSYSRMDWNARLKLPPLAKYLHAFYASHEHPIPIKVELFHELTNSGVAQLRMFRYKLKQALNLLVENGLLASAQIDPHTDTVIVERHASRLQLAQQ